MLHPHDTNITIAEQRLSAYFRSSGRADHACFQIHAAVAQRRRALFVQLRYEKQPYARRLFVYTRNERWSEILDKAAPVSKCEGSYQSFQVQALNRTQDRFGLLYELTDVIPKLKSTRGWNQTASSSDE
jgi:hypothetical protein